MSQGSSESVQEFAARINKLGTQIFQSSNSAQNTAVRNANDQLLQSRFISGLRNDIRRFVLARDPINLDESINVALIEEQNVKLNQIVNDERSGSRDIRLSYTYEKNSDTPQNKYEYVEKLLPSLEQIFNKVLNNLKDQEASHVDLSTRATKQHHYDYKIGSLCFIKTPNIKSNLSPKLRPKFEGPYRVIERFSNGNYRVQHVEQLRKRFNTHVNRMIPFIKRFSYLHLNNLDNLQPDETEVKAIVPSSWYNLRARAGNPAH
ncbi:integrase catalytic domain-containing protein [Trichonephila clavipes]|nr:integrase catalytic domain-containing protein [Trichonephila clavipes]